MRLRRTVTRTGVALTSTFLLGVLPGCEPAPVVKAIAPCSTGWVSLTFDDGPDPSPKATALVLDQLKAKRTKATFFLVGRQIEWWPWLSQRTVAEGHRVANHTYSHPSLATSTDAEVRSEFVKTNQAFAAAGLPRPNLQRPPFGATNARVDAIGESLGLTQALWNVDPRDWENPSANEIRSRIRQKVRPNSIVVVLLHDAYTQNTAEAVPGIIDDLRADGYCFAFMEPDARMEPGIGKIKLVPAEAVPTTTTTTTTAPTTTSTTTAPTTTSTATPTTTSTNR